MTRTVRGAILLCLFTQALVGCGPTTPAPPPPPPPPPPALNLTGIVHNPFGMPLPEARVEVVGGPSDGATTMTDGGGRFTFPGPFNRGETIRASKDGYVAASRSFAAFLTFQLEALPPSADIAGDYTATLIADPACAGLTEEVRRRTYRLKIESSSSSHGVFSDASFMGGYDTLFLFVSDKQVTVSTDFDDIPWLVERIASDAYLGVQVVGSAWVEPPVTTISIPVSGSIEYCVNSPMSSFFQCTANQPVAKCESHNHRLILDRR